MVLTELSLRVSDVSRPANRVVLKFLAGSAATYSVVPPAVWKKLGIESDDTIDFGSHGYREIGEARFHFQGSARVSPVILGAAGDVPLLGVVTLETLGLMLNPLRRELVPIRAVLAPNRP